MQREEVVTFLEDKGIEAEIIDRMLTKYVKFWL